MPRYLRIDHRSNQKSWISQDELKGMFPTHFELSIPSRIDCSAGIGLVESFVSERAVNRMSRMNIEVR